MSDLTVGGTQLLVDIYAGPSGSVPEEFAQHDGRIFFAARTLEHGTELWSTDGTAAGTVRETDLEPGPGNGLSSFQTGDVVASAGFLFFTCSTPATGEELCVLPSGARGDAVQVLDINLGADSTFVQFLSPVGTGVCFRANFPGIGLEPGCSDGTVGGTDPLGDLETGALGSLSNNFTALGSDRVAFTATVDNGNELWVADLVNDTLTEFDLVMGAGSSSPSGFVSVPSGVYFAANTPANGLELHFLRDSDDSVTLLETAGGLASGQPGWITPLGDLVALVADDGTSGREVWLANGVNQQITRLAEIVVGPGSADPSHLLATPAGFLASADDGVSGRELWLVRPDGAFQQADLAPGPNGSDPVPRLLGAGGVVVSASLTDQAGNSLYAVVDGRGGSVTQLSPDVRETGSDPTSLTVLPSGRLAFAAEDSRGAEPWLYDGGAQLISDVNLGSAGSRPQEFAGLGPYVLFTTFAGGVPDEPYLWDGGSLQRVDLRALEDSRPSRPVVVGNRFMMRATNDLDEQRVFSIDPAVPAIEEFAFDGEIVPAPSGGFLTRERELYVTDGSQAGTTPVTTLPLDVDILPIGVLDLPAGDLFVFLQAGLWVSDGTENGTVQVAPEGPFSAPRGLWQEGQRGLFLAYFAEYSELFLTDGTELGSSLATDRASDPEFEPAALWILGTVPGGWLLADSRSDSGPEPWFFDGVNPPVVLDLWPGPAGSAPGSIGRIGDLFYFWATTPERGREMWRTDGTFAGTEALPDLHPGPAGESISEAVVVEDRIVFSANGPEGDGKELWVYEPFSLFCDGFEEGDTAAWSAAVP